ncbi:hypothetical protein BHE74_00014287 [Ensete ventricosum]|nr:hypothetical protein BHE74_00014287 [Ensete ventricosum]
MMQTITCLVPWQPLPHSRRLLSNPLPFLSGTDRRRWSSNPSGIERKQNLRLRTTQPPVGDGVASHQAVVASVLIKVMSRPASESSSASFSMELTPPSPGTGTPVRDSPHAPPLVNPFLLD